MSEEISDLFNLVSSEMDRVKKAKEKQARLKRELAEAKQSIMEQTTPTPAPAPQKTQSGLDPRLESILKGAKGQTKKNNLQEGLLSINPQDNNSDPLTPLDQNFVTVDELKQHYKLFLNRVQQQLATVGGGGETRLEFLDDVDRSTAKINGRYLRYDSSIDAWVGAAGGGGGSQTLDDTLLLGNTSTLGMVAGISTFNNVVVGGATTALLVNGSARITDILSIGTATITFDGSTNTITADNIVVNTEIVGPGGVAYATTSYVATTVQEEVDAAVGVALTGSIQTEINDSLVGYATEAFVTASLVGYATEGYVDAAIAAAGLGVTELQDLNNVVITLPTVNQVLKYDGTNWINGVDSGGGSGIGLSDLSAVTTAPSGIGTLSYNDVNGVFTFTPGVIPTQLGELTNNVGFITTGALAGYATEGYVDAAVAGAGFTVSTRDGVAGINSTDAVSNVKALRFDSQSGFGIQDLGSGEVFVQLNSTFNPWQVSGQTDLTASGEEAVEFIAGAGVSITTNATSTPKSITFSATATGGGQGYWQKTSAGINTTDNVGIGSTIPTSRLVVEGDASVSGAVTATRFVGDGSGLTGVTAEGTGIGIERDGSVVGTAATINFAGNLAVSNVTAGIVTVTGGGISRASQEFTATLNQSVFAFTYTVGAVEVFVNGVKLNSTEYIANNGTDVQLNIPCKGGESVQLTSYDGTGGPPGLGVEVKDEGVTVGIATVIDFAENLFVTPIFAGIVTVTSGGGGGGTGYWTKVATGIVTASNVGINTNIITSALDITADGNESNNEFEFHPLKIQQGSRNRALMIGYSTTFADGDEGAYINAAGNGNVKPIYLSTRGNDQTPFVAIGTDQKTGTDRQMLQVHGGSYISGPLGIGVTNPTDRLEVAGNVSATSFSGDGSQLTGIVATGNGIGVEDSGSFVGTATTVDFGSNLTVSAISSGIVTISASLENAFWEGSSTGITTTAPVGIATTAVGTLALTVNGGAFISQRLVASDVIVPTSLAYRGSGDLDFTSTLVAENPTTIANAINSLRRNIFYILSSNGSKIDTYSINNSGISTIVGSTDISSISGSQHMAVTPNSKYMYVTRPSENLVHIYAINTTTGVVSSKIGTAAAVSGPTEMEIDPYSQYLYVCCQGNNRVIQYSINSDGTLSKIREILVSNKPFNVVIDPSRRFAYVLGEVSGTLSNLYAYEIDQTSGQFTLVDTITSLTQPDLSVIDRSGRFLYIKDGSNIMGYKINQISGRLESIESYPTAFLVKGLSIDPATGGFLFVTVGNNTIKSLRIDSVSGRLKEVSSKTLPTAFCTTHIIDPAGKFVIVNDFGLSKYHIYAINSSSFGAMSASRIDAGEITVDEVNVGIVTATGDIKSTVGDFVASDSGHGLVLTSPNGTKHRITIADNGAINITVI